MQLQTLYGAARGRSLETVGAAYAHVEDIDVATPLQRSLQYGNGVYGGVEGIASLMPDSVSSNVYFLLRHGDGEHLFTPVAQAAPGGSVALTPTCASGGDFAASSVQSLAIGPQNRLATSFAATDVFPRSGITFGVGADCRVLYTDTLEESADIALGNALVFANGDSVDATSLKLTANPAEGRPTAGALVRGHDGAVWGLDISHNSVLRMPTPTSTQSYALPNGSVLQANAALAPSDTGDLYFTAQGAGGSSQLGRISSSGTIAMMSLPVLANAGGVAVGRDAALWLVGTAHDGNAMLLRVDGDQTITSLSLTAALHLSQAAQAQGGIVRGFDGSLWFGVLDFYGFGAPNDVYLHLLRLT